MAVLPVHCVLDKNLCSRKAGGIKFRLLLWPALPRLPGGGAAGTASSLGSTLAPVASI